MRTGFLPHLRLLCCVLLATLAGGVHAAERVDLLIRNGTIYDGRGGAPVRGDVAVRDGRVIAMGTLSDYSATREVNANGLAVAPGFINTLSWATESLLHDGRGMSDIKQGVTLEIFGEGNSMGPVNDRDPRRDAQDAERHSFRRQLEHAGRIPGDPGQERRLAERRIVHRRDDCARVRASATTIVRRQPKS